MKTRLFLVIGIFLMVFSIDAFLLLDSSMPGCRGFTGMSLFVFVTLGFDSRTILSNPDCYEAFTGQIVSGMLFAIGFGFIVHLIVRRYKNIQNNRINYGRAKRTKRDI